MIETTQFEILADGLDHPECVTWGPDERIYAGGEAGQVYRLTLEGQVDQLACTGGFILGLCLDAEANVYLCDPGNDAIMRVSAAGEVDQYFAGLDGTLVNPNYAVFDDAGNLYFSESGHFGQDDGRLWVVHPGGAGEIWREDLRAFPNGLALSPDGAFIYVVLSTLPGVARAPVSGGRAETVVTFERKVPDGIAFDRQGSLYVSFYTPDEIWKVSPDGSAELLAEDWQRTTLASPTNIAFCGPDLGTLVVASLGRWHLAKVKAPVPGLPYRYPSLA